MDKCRSRYGHLLQKYGGIKAWMCADETHEYCNMISLVMMCRTKNGDKLLDGNGEELTSINDVVDAIAGIRTLNTKPKLLTIQAYIGKVFTSQFLSIRHFI